MAFDERKLAKLVRLTSRVFNTFSEEQAEFVVRSSKNWHSSQRQEIIDRVDVPLIPINEIIDEHMPGHAKPDFVSIDIEGVELPVLRSLDVGKIGSNPKRPALFCIEAHGALEDFEAILKPHGFQFSGRTPDNWLFRRDPV